MSTEYVRQDEHGVLRVADTHVMLDSVVAGFERGHSAETIQNHYPALTLEQVYGAIAWYLGHPQEAEEYLRRQDAVWDQARQHSVENPSAVVERLRAMRRVGARAHRASAAALR
ncbi:MAG: hypothetical protein AMXMBFR13_26840 [Phycisphaerae bacterium]